LPPGRVGGNPVAGSKEAQEKSRILDQVQASLDAAMAGQSLAALEAGEYTLNEIVSHVKYVNTRNSDSFAVIRKSRPTLNGNTWTLNAEPEGLGVGLVAGVVDASGRKILIPGKMNVVGST